MRVLGLERPEPHLRLPSVRPVNAIVRPSGEIARLMTAPPHGGVTICMRVSGASTGAGRTYSAMTIEMLMTPAIATIQINRSRRSAGVAAPATGIVAAGSATTSSIASRASAMWVQPLFRILLQTAAQDVGKGPMGVSAGSAFPVRLAPQDVGECVRHVVAAEQSTPRQHLEDDHAERPECRRGVSTGLPFACSGAM
jgi:hypothetical protein